jgi:hypothetical protein
MVKLIFETFLQNLLITGEEQARKHDNAQTQKS